MKSQSSKQQGFTLIELITVIILLGVLSVTALPKFVNFSSDANAAVINNLAAGLKAAANLGNAGGGYTAIVAGGCYVSYESFVNDYKEPEIVKDTSGC